MIEISEMELAAVYFAAILMLLFAAVIFSKKKSTPLHRHLAWVIHCEYCAHEYMGAQEVTLCPNCHLYNKIK